MQQKAFNSKKKYVISVAGESGSGKSEIAHEIKKIILNNGVSAEIFAQDDYFVFPPKTNHNMRINNPEQVGLYEVKLDFLDANLFDFKNEVGEIYKPLVNYDKDMILYQIVDVNRFDVIIVEGTYTTVLEFVDKKIFINRKYVETKKDRIERGRDKIDSFIEQVLEKEHRIIKIHKQKSNIIIKPDFSDIEILGK